MKTAQRLFVQAPLAAGARVELDAGQAHYLAHVLRLQAGAEVLVFNGTDGEWRTQLEIAGRKGGAVVCTDQLRPQDHVPDLELWFAPIKGDRCDAIAEKATELGAACLRPVITERTIVRKPNLDRLRARALEAAEQTGRLSVPAVAEAEPLARVLAALGPERRVLFADEAGDPQPVAAVAAGLSGPLACLVGPEGGFTPAERSVLRSHAQVVPVSLGPRILRADTAAFAMLALVQAGWGDWR